MIVPVLVNHPGAAVVQPSVPQPVPELVPVRVQEQVPEEDVLVVQAHVWEDAVCHVQVLAKGHVQRNVRLVSSNNTTYLQPCGLIFGTKSLKYKELNVNKKTPDTLCFTGKR